MSTGIITFAGQSNMVGFRSDPGLLPASELDELISYSTYNTAGDGTMGNPAGEYGILRAMVQDDGGGNGWTENITLPAGFSSWGYGPEISCCRALYDEDKLKVAACKWALGGQSLNGTFNPLSPTTGTGGFGYKGLRDYMNGLESALANDNKYPYHLAFVWCQGEEDATNQDQAELYEYNFRRFIAHIRAIARNPTMPFVIVQTVTPLVAPYLQQVKDAQAKMAAEIPNVYLYIPSTTALPLYTDDVHFWEDAMVTIGEDVAAIIQSDLGV